MKEVIMQVLILNPCQWQAVSVASSERSFSKLQISKNYLRSTMAEERLDALMIVTCSSDVLDNLDLDKLENAWSLLKTRRIKIFYYINICCF